jgi:hypothetical protein
VTIATDSGGRQRTLTDGLPQARCAEGLAVYICTWLRDEEARQGVQADAPERLDRTDDLSSLGLVFTLGQETGIPKFL